MECPDVAMSTPDQKVTESPIATRTRSMRKRLSLSQTSQSTSPERAPKSNVRNKSRNSSPVQSNIESPRKSSRQSHHLNKPNNTNSQNSENSERSKVVSQPKLKNVKQLKVEVSPVSKQITEESPRQENEQPADEEELKCNGDVKKKRKRGQKTAKTQVSSAEGESCNEVKENKVSVTKNERKVDNTISKAQSIPSSKLEETAQKLEGEDESTGDESMKISKTNKRAKKSKHSQESSPRVNQLSEKEDCDMSNSKTEHHSSTKRKKSKAASHCVTASDASTNMIIDLESEDEVKIVSSKLLRKTEEQSSKALDISSKKGKLKQNRLEKSVTSFEIKANSQENDELPLKVSLSSDAREGSLAASTSKNSAALQSSKDEDVIGFNSLKSTKTEVKDNVLLVEIDSSDIETKKLQKVSVSGSNKSYKVNNKVINKTCKDEVRKSNSKLVSNNQSQTKVANSISSVSLPKLGFVVEKLNSLTNKQNYPDSDSDAESRKAIMESAQRRIEQNLSTSESDSRYLAKTPHKSSARKPVVEAGSSDSGSAPEDVSFESGKKSAMESLKNAVESIQREKQRRKAKRKERLEKLKQQKEEKLIRLKEKLASQEDASCSSSEESGYEEVAYESKKGKKKRSPKNKALRTEKENVEGASLMVLKKTAFSDMESDDSSTKPVATAQLPPPVGLKRLPQEVLESLPDQIPLKYPKISQDDNNKKKKKKERTELNDNPDKDFKKPINLDYIPLETGGPTKFSVVPLEKALKAPKSISQQAADFRQNMLYGSRIKREPAKTSVIYQQKMKASGNDIHVR